MPSTAKPALGVPRQHQRHILLLARMNYARSERELDELRTLLYDKPPAPTLSLAARVWRFLWGTD